jgi:hypothetical protein
MKTLAYALVIGAVLTTLSANKAAATSQPSGTHDQVTSLVGIVVDALCAGKTAEHRNPAECARLCAKAGARYALVVDNKIYVLDADQKLREQLDLLAGERAKVVGTVNSEVMKVTSVAPVK